MRTVTVTSASGLGGVVVGIGAEGTCGGGGGGGGGEGAEGTRGVGGGGGGGGRKTRGERCWRKTRLHSMDGDTHCRVVGAGVCVCVLCL